MWVFNHKFAYEIKPIEPQSPLNMRRLLILCALGALSGKKISGLYNYRA
jgi:hypothetical protein